MQAINPHAIISRSPQLTYASGETRCGLPIENDKQITAVGLVGRDVLFAREGSVWKFDVSEQHEEQLIAGDDGLLINRVCGSEQTHLLAFCVDDQVFMAFGTKTRQIKKLRTSGPVHALALASAAPVVAVGLQGAVRIYNPASGTAPVMRLDCESPCRALSFCPMGYYIGGLSEAGELIVWDLITGGRVHEAVGFGKYTDLSLQQFGPLVVDLLSKVGARRIRIDKREDSLAS